MAQTSQHPPLGTESSQTRRWREADSKIAVDVRRNGARAASDLSGQRQTEVLRQSLQPGHQEFEPMRQQSQRRQSLRPRRAELALMQVAMILRAEVTVLRRPMVRI